MQYHLSTMTEKGFAYEMYEFYLRTTIILAKFDIFYLYDLDVVCQMRNVNFMQLSTQVAAFFIQGSVLLLGKTINGQHVTKEDVALLTARDPKASAFSSD